MRSIIIVALGLFSSSLFAQYQPMAACGKAEIKAGKTCKDLKVQFSFEGCHLKAPPMAARSVLCEGNKGFARLSHQGHRYQANLSMGKNSWGENAWVVNGKLQQWAEKSVIEKAKAKSMAKVQSPERTVASEEMKSHTKVSGYLTARHRYVKEDTNNTGNEVLDGAIYLSHEKGPASAFIDIPFFDSDTESGGDGSSNFLLGPGQGQAYVNFSFNQFGIMFGQFDTLYGFELNDSVDRLFTTPGIVFANTLPTVHNGLVLSYETDMFWAKLLASNEGGVPHHQSKDPEYGLMLGYTMGELFYVTVGYLGRSAEDKTRTLTEVLLGTKLGDFAIDLEYDIIAEDAALKDPDKAGTGIMLHVGYTMDQYIAGLRLEQVSNLGSFGISAAALAFGYNVTDNARVQIDFGSIVTEPNEGDDTVEGQETNLAFVYKFD